MRPDLCHAGLVVALEHQAWPADPCSLQHFIGLFAGVVELSATLNCAAQEVVHAHPREADCVFQDFDAFFGVESAKVRMPFSLKVLLHLANSERVKTYQPLRREYQAG